MLKILRQWILCFPHKIHWLFVLILALVIPYLTREEEHPGEWYPFSNFPMYSNFEKQAYYVYVTDKDNNALPTYPIFGTWPSQIKKIYDGEIKKIAKDLNKASKKLTAEERFPAGVSVLQQLRDHSLYPDEVKKHPVLLLQQVDITLKEGRIHKETTLVGENECLQQSPTLPRTVCGSGSGASGWAVSLSITPRGKHFSCVPVWPS